MKIILKCFRNGGKLKIHVNTEGRSRGYIMFYMRDDGFWVQKKTTADLDKENIQACLTLYCTVMAVMAFASPNVEAEEVDRKPRANKPKAPTKPNKPKNSGVTYIIHSTKHGPMALPSGHHASPKGIFSVRGHFRHYKNGRVVWIEEYKKGTGKKNKRKYRIAEDTIS